MLEEKNDIFLNKDDKIMSDEEWKNLGRPHIWVLEYDKIINGEIVKIYADASYGGVCLIIGIEIIKSSDMAMIKGIVVFGSSYGNPIIPYRPYILYNEEV